MLYVDLPGTEFRVSRVAFGAEPLGGADWGEVDASAALSAVHEALDLGINVFDTADVYGLGRSEELLSKALGSRRHDVVIVTKFGVRWEREEGASRARTFLDASRARVIAAVEDSLRRLRLDSIPICLVHWPDPDTPQTETFEALAELQDRGLVQHFGVSNYPRDLIEQVLEEFALSVIEQEYSLLKREAESSILPIARDAQLGVLTYGSLAQGLLTGKYDASSTFGEDDRRHRLEHFSGEGLQAAMRTVERLKVVAAKHDATPAQVAVAWVLDDPAVSSVIVGAKTPAQVRANASAVGINLSLEDRRLLQNSNAIGVDAVSEEVTYGA